jgi:hypothetical protein
MDHRLDPLRERHRLPLVVRAAVAHEHVVGVDREERVLRGSGRLRVRRVVLEFGVLEAFQGSSVLGLLVGPQLDAAVGGEVRAKQLEDVASQGLGIGAAELLFVGGPSLLLQLGHRAGTAAFGHDEVVAVVGARPDEAGQLEGPVLAAGEGAEAVHDERLIAELGLGRFSKGLVEQETVSSQTFDEALDGGVDDAELSGDLAVSGAGDFGAEDGFEEVGAAEPVGGGEGL